MDLVTQFYIFVLFAFIGFITDKIFGFDVYKVYSDIGAVVFITTLYGFIAPILITPERVSIDEVTSRLELMISFFVNSFPSIVLGDLAGTFVSEITGRK